jgi:hypothetical protein
MPSPFPGMNPYLEQDDCWQDFHQTYVKELRDRIVSLVGSGYVVKLESHIYVHELGVGTRQLVGRTDVGVSRKGHRPSTDAAVAALEAPLKVRLPAVDFEMSDFIEIRDKESRALVTVIEMLSPSNKKGGPDREQYLGKRLFLLYKQVHFVELDFLRGCPRMPIPGLPACDYYALVRRASEWPPVLNIWPINLKDALPPIPIPLREPDADVQVDLQQVLHAAYDSAQYGNYIYQGSPYPELSAEDSLWTRQFVVT